ncbi:hypothetical protein [Nocardia sp. CA-145437]|uniref:hypothetical protein n=1 Tax=Nocardia sp. CA-145437 TaxID=3239980 RepID=UPI003D968566
MPTGTIGRIQRLRSLIEHPRTGAAERAAAQRMLDRILAKTSRSAARPGERSYGVRHARPGRHASLSRIAEMIAEDIAVLSAVHDAPDLLTYSVEAPAEAGILITVGAIPRGWATDADGVDSPALRVLVDELTDLMNAYNHEGTDVARRFIGRVRTRIVD